MSHQISEFGGKIESLLFKKAAWFLFLIIIGFVFGGCLFFYFKVWSIINSPSSIPRVDLPLNRALWHSILSAIDQRQIIKEDPELIRDIFKVTP